MRNLGVVALVVVGLFLIGGAISSIASAGYLFSPGGPDASVMTAFLGLSIVLALAFGIGLIAFRASIARRLFGDDDLGISVDAGALLTVGTALLGIDLVAEAVPRMVLSVSSAFVQHAMMQGGGEPGVGLGLLLVDGVASGLTHLAIGVGLVWGARPISAFLTRPRGQAATTPAALTCPECGAPYDPAEYCEGVERRCAACHCPLDSGLGAER